MQQLKSDLFGTVWRGEAGGREFVQRDTAGARWWTVGVSDNIIDASFQALMDSIVYKLLKNRGEAGRVAAE